MAISQVDPAPIGQHMTSSKKLTRYLPIFLTATGSIGRLFTRKKRRKHSAATRKMKKRFSAEQQLQPTLNGGTGASSNNDNAVVIIGLMTSISDNFLVQ